MANSPRPLISFIIPAYNEESSIHFTLESITQEEFPVIYEIIVVDHNSTDNTAVIAESFGATVVHKEGGTIASVRNFGVNNSRGSILVFLDADVSVTSKWHHSFESTIKKLKTNPMIITGSHCHPVENGNWIERNWFGSYVDEINVTNLGTGHMITTRQLFDRIGGFNEELATGEDYSFCMSALSKGGEIISNADLSAIHRNYPKNLFQFVRREAWHGIVDAVTIKSIMNSKVAIMSLTFLIFHIVALAAFFSLYSTKIFYVSIFGIIGIIVGSSWMKFKHCDIKTILINAYIFYFYFIGRAASIILTTFKRMKNFSPKQKII